MKMAVPGDPPTSGTEVKNNTVVRTDVNICGCVRGRSSELPISKYITVHAHVPAKKNRN